MVCLGYPLRRAYDGEPCDGLTYSHDRAPVAPHGDGAEEEGKERQERQELDGVGRPSRILRVGPTPRAM